MITTKKVATWLWTEFKREMVVQKPDPAMLARMEELRMAPMVRTETRQDRIFKTGMNGIGMFLLICVVVAVWVL